MAEDYSGIVKEMSELERKLAEQPEQLQDMWIPVKVDSDSGGKLDTDSRGVLTGVA